MVGESKTCNICKEAKSLDAFCKDMSRSDGKAARCRECAKGFYHRNKDKILKQHQEYYKENAEQKKAYQSEYRKAKMAEDPNWKKLKEMAYKVGKTFEEVESWFNKQWMKQQAQCAICGKVFCDDDCIDHNHETNELRGLLCNLCNVGIGALKDSPAICLKANEYLIETEGI